MHPEMTGFKFKPTEKELNRGAKYQKLNANHPK